MNATFPLIRWSVVCILLLTVLGSPSSEAATPTKADASPNKTLNIGDSTFLFCRFVSAANTTIPVANQRVDLLRSGQQIASTYTDGNGYANWTTTALFGPEQYTFRLRPSARWGASEDSVVVTGLLPVTMSARLRSVTGVQRGYFTAIVTVAYAPAIDLTMARTLANRPVTVVLKHTGVADPVSISLRTGWNGMIETMVSLPSGFRRQGQITVTAVLPRPNDRVPGYFSDSNPNPSPWVRNVPLE